MSGEDAIRLARNKRYDLILMDQRMPKMDGTEALRRIRAQADGANLSTPVICLTADAVKGAKERYISEGFTDYLTKPIDSAALEKMMIKYLPADKIIAVQGEEPDAAPAPEAAQTGPGDPYAPLRAAGVQPSVGLRYCQDDAPLYSSLLAEFGQGSRERSAQIQSAFEAGDWKLYGILVHAVKSSARMIGADELSRLAASLEAAADNARTDTILAGHQHLMRIYEKTADACLRQGEAEPHGEEPEVLEFSPE